MNAVPDWIVAIDSELNEVKRYRRLEADSEFGAKLKEKDYDRLIFNQVGLLAATLREAGIISENSELLALSTRKQIKSIDVLLAEIDRDTKDFMRLVLIEDKLFANPQARREVLAQILDYARVVEEVLDVDALVEELPEHEGWLLKHRLRIENTMRSGNYLLLICGDHIQERLLRLADRFIERANTNPLNHTDLCLVSLSIYSDGNNHFLVPNVVGAVIGAKRELMIRVQVQNIKGEPLEAVVELAEDPEPPKAGPRSEEEFFVEYKTKHGESAVNNCKAILAALKESGLSDLRLTNSNIGRPVVYLDNTPWGSIDVCTVSRKEPCFHDNLHIFLNRYGDDPYVVQTVAHFRQFLCDLGGSLRQKKGLVSRVYIPLGSLAGNTQGFIEAFKQFVDALKHNSEQQAQQEQSYN